MQELGRLNAQSYMPMSPSSVENRSSTNPGYVGVLRAMNEAAWHRLEPFTSGQVTSQPTYSTSWQPAHHCLHYLVGCPRKMLDSTASESCSVRSFPVCVHANLVLFYSGLMRSHESPSLRCHGWPCMGALHGKPIGAQIHAQIGTPDIFYSNDQEA
jgi:hypothetical protein